MTGKSIRLKKLYKHSDHLFIVAMDHGITLGPIEGIEHIGQAVQSVFKGNADAVVVHKGLVNQIVPVLDLNSGELIIHLSASTSMSPDPNQKELVTSVEHAVRLGATAISVHVNIGSPTEASMLEHLGRVAEESDKWGMPLLAMMYVRDGNKEHEFNPIRIRHAAELLKSWVQIL